MIARALLAPFDKTGIADFARILAAKGVELVATSGTARVLREAGLEVREVSDLTGFPEMLGGRVKTLHPRIHGGLLGRRDDPEHVAQMKEHEIPAIDLLCLNLYPFEDTIARPDATFADAVEMIDIGGPAMLRAVNLYPFERTVAGDCGVQAAIENIDVGGPAMLRAAAKNHAHVVPLVDAADYAGFVERWEDDALDAGYRRGLAAKAFRHTTLYDAAIARYMAEGDALPEAFVLAGEQVRELRYGENPHQRAALYRTSGGAGLADAEVLNGKPLSFNNLQDAAGAYATVSDFEEPTAVVVKHANPCGAASSDSLLQAFRKAWDGDALSAFGGILAFNRTLTADVADAIAEPGRFVEVVIAPGFAPDALSTLREKPKWGKNVRILACPLLEPGGLEVRPLPGGFLVQDQDREVARREEFEIVTKRAPTEEEVLDLVFAQRVCKHVKSNAIVLASGRAVAGVGAGQMSRVDASRMAVRKAGGKAKGAVFASDAFLPFNDALEIAVDAGATAAIQPGGSRNDDKCIEFANERGIAMVFTRTRHFLH